MEKLYAEQVEEVTRSFMKKIIVIFVIFSMFSIPFVPIKYCEKSISKQSNDEFYLIRFDSIKNTWLLCGDKNGVYDWDTAPERYVFLENKRIENIVSGDIYLNNVGTTFIVWGQASYHEERANSGDNSTVITKQYTINCNKWSVLGDVYSRNSSMSKKYLTILDYKWFDVLRSFLGLYSEY